MILLSVLVNPIRKITILHKKVIIGIYHYYIYIYIYISVCPCLILNYCIYVYVLQFSKSTLFQAIDEAEDKWSQHNAKKLIDTTEKELQASIPQDFPYFHVQFGLNKGFLHVIDNEDEFKSSLGINVIRGMLQLPVEDMHGQRRYDSVEVQKEAVKSFVQDWEPFDWTKQLHHS